MGQIAEALRANLKAVAESDARALRDLKSVSAVWRRRARLTLGDPTSAWRKR